MGDQVHLYNSRLKLFLGKSKSRWSGPFTVSQVISYGIVELHHPVKRSFKVNGQRIKHYIESLELAISTQSLTNDFKEAFLGRQPKFYPLLNT